MCTDLRVRKKGDRILHLLVSKRNGGCRRGGLTRELRICCKRVHCCFHIRFHGCAHVVAPELEVLGRFAGQGSAAPPRDGPLECSSTARASRVLAVLSSTCTTCWVH